ncbi:MAG: hypothetical protein LBG04_03490 [Holosporaceae bacterium]|jgi:hypothetical protein|nr:hypothetical protein [Holosporaceae bacterium]
MSRCVAEIAVPASDFCASTDDKKIVKVSDLLELTILVSAAQQKMKDIPRFIFAIDELSKYLTKYFAMCAKSTNIDLPNQAAALIIQESRFFPEGELLMSGIMDKTEICHDLFCNAGQYKWCKMFIEKLKKVQNQPIE